MKLVTLPSGEQVPALGVGTWRMGEDMSARAQEVTALRHALERGLSLIDTAEMYGDGGAEEVVAEAIAGRRDEAFIVSKVLPQNATREGIARACERSLGRLQSGHIDLYLLHWPGGSDFTEVVETFERLKADGKIRHWGVSNFSTKDVTELHGLKDGKACAANQVLYHLGERGIEWQLLPYCQAHGLPIMAYTPFGGRVVLGHPTIREIAEKHGTGPGAVALAWLLRNDGVIAIPKALQLPHIDEIARVPALTLEASDLGMLEVAFPAPAAPASIPSVQGAGRRPGHD